MPAAVSASTSQVDGSWQRSTCRPPGPRLAASYRRDVIVHPDWRRCHRNSVVVLTALIAVLAMHGLTSDHGMGMPSMRVTAGPAMHGGSDPHHVMSSVLTAAASQLRGSVVASSVSAAADQLGHAGGVCVGILGIALLLWLLARSRRSQHLPASFRRRLAARAIQSRAGPLPPLLCPSLVRLGISRT